MGNWSGKKKPRNKAKRAARREARDVRQTSPSSEGQRAGGSSNDAEPGSGARRSATKVAGPVALSESVPPPEPSGPLGKAQQGVRNLATWFNSYPPQVRYGWLIGLVAVLGVGIYQIVFARGAGTSAPITTTPVDSAPITDFNPFASAAASTLPLQPTASAPSPVASASATAAPSAAPVAAPELETPPSAKPPAKPPAPPKAKPPTSAPPAAKPPAPRPPPPTAAPPAAEPPAPRPPPPTAAPPAKTAPPPPPAAPAVADDGNPY